MDTWLEILKNDNYLLAMQYIKEGADVNEKNDLGESILTLALRNQCDMDLIQLLIDKGANIFHIDNEGVSIFDMAVSCNYIELVEFLIQQGIDVNATKRKSQFTSLMAAACYGRVEITQLLLENGADKSLLDSKGFTAIDFARKMNKKRILNLLDYDENSKKNLNFAK